MRVFTAALYRHVYVVNPKLYSQTHNSYFQILIIDTIYVE